MKVQIKKTDGNYENIEINNTVDFVVAMSQVGTDKISFDFLDGSRLALYKDGTFQIFGGLVNYPHIVD